MGRRTMKRQDQLQVTLSRMDGKGYKAYKEIEGSYDFGLFSLHVDHVQGDPFAAPSKMRLRVAMNRAGFPPALFQNKVRSMAFEDFVGRQVHKAMTAVTRKGQGSGKSGMMSIDAGGQEILDFDFIV
ncbi:MAG: ABC-ATPase domain-containing protein [Thermodesulfobacteriota bacterium]|nr:ABC-ATPase domain-containing protein [Thermodesulfobacteriota bacterium]